jgi:HAD superfamily hydrolase (TIGR01509 family)
MDQNKLKLVLFDLDGVILNSEPLHDHAKKRILLEAGVTEDLDLSWSVGKPSRMLWNQMRNIYGLKLSEDELEQRQYDYILEEIKEKQIPPSEGLLELLSWLKENQIRIGLVSSSWGSFVHSVIDYYNIKCYFDYNIAGDDVERKKPFPDGYLKALCAFEIPTNNAIAVEDSETGSEAAIAAQLKCIGYQNPTSGKQDLTKCHKVIVNLTQIKQVAISF